MMKRSFSKAVLGAFMAGVALLLVSVGSWSKGPADVMAHDPERMLVHLTERLDLSDDQQDQVRALLSDSRERTAAEREEMRSLHEQLRALRGQFDADKARALTRRMGEITGDMMYEFAQVQAETYALLNDQQKQRMEKIMAEREDRRDRRHGGPDHD